MIISGGFNVFPNEVEQVALSHPAVQDCVIVGVPDEKWGESVLAAVQVKSGVVFDADDFIAFCKRELGSVKAPKRVEIWETLPRSTVGKTLRRVVREKYWEGRDRMI
jgi:acyl-CoA synthetase (AMP-forming)/AMP-acid ligase II